MMRALRPVFLQLFYFTVLGFLFSCYMFFYLYRRDFSADPWSAFVKGPTVFSFFVMEAAILAWVVSLLRLPGAKPRILQIMRRTLVLLVLWTQALQFFALYYTNNFLESGVAAHVAVVMLMVNAFTLSTVICFVAGGYAGFFLLFEGRESLMPIHFSSWKDYAFANGGCAILIILMMVANKHVPWVAENKLTYPSGNEAPTPAMVKMLGRFESSMDDALGSIELTAEDAALARAYGLDINLGEKLPVHRTQAYSNTSTFPELRPGKKSNIIVLLVESLSADLVGVYQKRWRDVTPHMEAFSQKALVMREYYNHVTPTIVGVRGQLCSHYPKLSHTVWSRAKSKLDSGNMRCLPHVLAQNGYDTHYLGYSHPGETFFGEQMREVGFSKTYFYKELVDEFLGGGGAELGLKGNSDRQMFEALRVFLERQTANAKNPFFVTMSTVETHPGMDIDDEARQYKGANNAVLNVVHNFDQQFGKFLEYFFASPFADNTILILTADHSHTPSAELREVASERYIENMFNEVTLMIYDPWRHLRGDKIARTTSVDLAPTILQLLSIRKVEDSFLGHSMFDQPQSPERRGSLGFAFQGRMFRIGTDGSRSTTQLSLANCASADFAQKHREDCALYRSLIFTQDLLLAGKMVPP